MFVGRRQDRRTVVRRRRRPSREAGARCVPCTETRVSPLSVFSIEQVVPVLAPSPMSKTGRHSDGRSSVASRTSVEGTWRVGRRGALAQVRQQLEGDRYLLEPEILGQISPMAPRPSRLTMRKRAANTCTRREPGIAERGQGRPGGSRRASERPGTSAAGDAPGSMRRHRRDSEAQTPRGRAAPRRDAGQPAMPAFYVTLPLRFGLLPVVWRAQRLDHAEDRCRESYSRLPDMECTSEKRASGFEQGWSLTSR